MSEELACWCFVCLTTLSPPLTPSLSPISQTVTWQSAQQRCDCWSNLSRSNTKRLLICRKTSFSDLNILFCKRKHPLSENNFFFLRWKAHEGTVWGVHCFTTCIFACVCHRGILSYALLLAMSVISSKNPNDMAWAAFQGYSFSLLNSRSLSAPIIILFGSLTKVVFKLILFRLIASVCSFYMISFIFILD